MKIDWSEDVTEQMEQDIEVIIWILYGDISSHAFRHQTFPVIIVTRLMMQRNREKAFMAMNSEDRLKEEVYAQKKKDKEEDSEERSA